MFQSIEISCLLQNCLDDDDDDEDDDDGDD